MDILPLAARYFKIPLDVIDLNTEIDVLCVLKCINNDYSLFVNQLHVKLSDFCWSSFHPKKIRRYIYFDLYDFFRANGLDCGKVCTYRDQRNSEGYFSWQIENMGFAIELYDLYYSDKMPFYDLWNCLINLNRVKDAPILNDLLHLERYYSADAPSFYLYHDN